jgi:Tol biopolymer transport system component
VAAQVATLEEQVKARPGAKALYLKLADLQQHAGQKDAAIHALERLLGVDPGNALAKHRIDVLRGTVHHAPPLTPVHPVTRPPHPVARPARRRSSRRGLWIGLGALGVVLVAGAFWFFSGPTRLAAGRGPVFSPQGDRIAYFTEAGGGATLHVYDLGSGRSRPLGRASFGFGGDAVAWSPDGRQVAFTAPSEGEFGPEAVLVADVETGARQELATGSSPTWSPDGLSIGMFCHERPQVLATTSTEEGDVPTAFGEGWDGVCLVSAADGSIRRLHEGTGNRLAFSPRSQTLVLERFPENLPDDAASPASADQELQSLADEAVAGGATNFYEGSRDLGRAIEARGLDKRGAGGTGDVVGNLFAVDADSGSVSALTDDGHSSNARWTADGRIVYVHKPAGASQAQLWVMEANGNGKQPLLKAPVALFDPAAVAVGGDRVVYAAPVTDVNAGMARIMAGEEAADLHLVRPGDGAGRRLKNRHTFKQRFTLSPDGRRVVYEANDRKTGQSELWLMKP